MDITELADLIRRGCDEDQREAENDRLKLCPTCREPIGEQSKQLAGVRYDCGHYFEWNRLFGLRDRETTTQTRALAHIAARRQLLDEALGWEHHQDKDGDPHYTCPILIWPHIPCDCGRDERVLAVLQTLAAPYQETT